MKKFLNKHIWPWKAMVGLKEALARERVEHANTKAQHAAALQKIKWHEETFQKADKNMHKMAQIIMKTSGFGD